MTDDTSNDDLYNDLFGPKPQPELEGEQKEIYEALFGPETPDQLEPDAEALYNSLFN